MKIHEKKETQSSGETYLHNELAGGTKCMGTGPFFGSEDKALFIFLKAGIIPEILYATHVRCMLVQAWELNLV